MHNKSLSGRNFCLQTSLALHKRVFTNISVDSTANLKLKFAKTNKNVILQNTLSVFNIRETIKVFMERLITFQEAAFEISCPLYCRYDNTLGEKLIKRVFYNISRCFKYLMLQSKFWFKR